MKKRKPKNYWDEEMHESESSLVLNGLTVTDGPDFTVHTGLLDAQGRPITYQVETMGKIGFVHFPDPEEEAEE